MSFVLKAKPETESQLIERLHLLTVSRAKVQNAILFKPDEPFQCQWFENSDVITARFSKSEGNLDVWRKAKVKLANTFIKLLDNEIKSVKKQLGIPK